MPEDKFECNASLSKNILAIGIENLGELEELIHDVKEKEKALHEAVRKLELYKLEVSFRNK